MKIRDWAILTLVLFLLPVVITSPYHHYILGLAGIYSILAVGLNFVMGLGGQTSLAHAAFWGIGAYASSLFVLRLNVPFIPALILGGLAGAIGGVALGVPSLKIRSFYLAITTIGFNQIVNLLLNNWVNVTRGADGLPGIPPPSIGSLVLDTPVKKYYVITACLLLVVWMFARVKDSRVGRALQALRDNDFAAELMGVDVRYYKVLAFTLSAAIAGFAGGLFAHFVGYISPDNFLGSESLVILCMLLLGGSGSVWGPVIGASVLVILPEWLRFLRDYYVAIYGLAVTVMAIKMPTGLVGVWNTFLARYGERLSRFRPQRCAFKEGDLK